MTARERELYTWSAGEYVAARKRGEVTCEEYAAALVKRARYYRYFIAPRIPPGQNVLLCTVEGFSPYMYSLCIASTVVICTYIYIYHICIIYMAVSHALRCPVCALFSHSKHCLPCDRADMSAVLTQQTCLLCRMADISAQLGGCSELGGFA